MMTELSAAPDATTEARDRDRARGASEMGLALLTWEDATVDVWD